MGDTQQRRNSLLCSFQGDKNHDLKALQLGRQMIAENISDAFHILFIISKKDDVCSIVHNRRARTVSNLKRGSRVKRIRSAGFQVSTFTPRFLTWTHLLTRKN